MKNKIIIPVLSVVIGLIVGYFIFGGNASSEDGDHTDQVEKKDQIWTCSMHPQIRRNEPGDCPICGMDLIPLEANSNENPLVFEMTEDAIRIANILTTKIGNNHSQNSELALFGKIKADETTASSIVTHIPGRIEKLYVSFTGEKVSRGQKIASIYSSKLITAQRELLEAYKLKDMSPQLLEAAKNKLRYWKISNNDINEIIKSQKIKEYFDIRADHSGIIQLKKVSVGDYLGEGGVLFQLQNLNKLWAVFDVYEVDLKSVELGSEITFSTPSISNKKFSSKIVFIDPIINSSTRTASVRLDIPNSKNFLKPEMFLNGHLKITPSAIHHKHLTVPKTAVLWTGERSVVYVKLPDVKVPSFEFREVTIGESIGSNYVVLDGLSSGDDVVTNGAFVIDASAQLNNKSSMMNRNLLAEKGKEINFDVPDYSDKTPLNFKRQLEKVIKSYISLKESLASDQVKGAIGFGKQMAAELKNVDMSLVKGDVHIYWMQEMSEIESQLKKLNSSIEIDAVRTSFDQLSLSIIKVTKSFGVEDKERYVQFCPMAFDDKGAYWLSDDSKVKNPYFGSQMLKCGVIKDTIK